jgi:phosphatidate cytidylyltransferase
MSNLQQRVLTAAVGLPLLFASVWIGGWPFAVIMGVVAFFAATEFVHGWLFPSRPLTAALPMAMSYGAVGLMVAGAHWNLNWVGMGIVMAVLLGIGGRLDTNRLGPRRPLRVQSGALLYIGLLFSTVVLVRDLDGGRDWLFLGVLATFAVDTGAYAVGKTIGRHKMAPKISPKKTWEGAAGGYVAGVGAVLGLNVLLGTDVPTATILPFALLLPIAAEAGDLFESWMKRRMGVKDASGLVPGHGGLLDRMDSILFVIPLLYVFLQTRVV